MRSRLPAALGWRRLAMAAAGAVPLLIIAMPARAVDCSATTTVSIPFTWTLERSGQDVAEIWFRNDGTASTVVSNSKVMLGSFRTDSRFTPPPGFCSQLDPTPTLVKLELVGRLAGSYTNSTLGFDANGFPFETYVRIHAGLDVVPAFTALSYGFGSGSFQALRATVRQVGMGELPYAGNLDVETKFGFGIIGVQGIQGHAWVDLQGSLVDPVVDVRFTVPVPGPSAPTLWCVGLLWLAWLRRRGLNSAG